jgi:adenylate kinase
LDGFPRTIPQAEALHSFAPPDHVLNFVADKKKIVERLSGRRTCSKCGAVFHLKYAPPENPEACDACGSRLVQRSDEQPNVILKRLAVYEEQTRPLVDYYQNEGLLGEIDANYGMGEMEKIMAQCEAALKG